MSLTVAFDWPRDHLGVSHGQFRYGADLFTALDRLNTDDRYVVLGVNPEPPPTLAALFAPGGRWTWAAKPLAAGRGSDWVNQWRSFRHLRRHRPDLVHVIDGTIPALAPCPVVATTHDVMVEVFRDEYTVWRASRGYKRFKWLNRRVVARHLASSRTTAADLVKWWGIPAERIDVVYLGVGKFPDPGDRWPQALAARFPELAGTRFVLSQYHLEPRKNLHALLAAFRDVREAAPDVRLALFSERGTTPEREAKFRQAVADLGLGGAVVQVGLVPDEELAVLYRAAEVCVFPSLYEGFGYPPLEALAVGGCVLARSASAMAEVVGPAGLLVETAEPGPLAAGITRLLADPAVRTAYRNLGPARAAEFSTERMARETRAVYVKVVGKG